MTRARQHLKRLRQTLGVWLLDWRRYRRLLAVPDGSWIRICNRGERLVPSPDGLGVECSWRWTSLLHAPQYAPSLGRDLLRRALSAYPIRFCGSDGPGLGAVRPDVSFVVGHRGVERLPLLNACLRALGAQSDVGVEIVVVEQSARPEIAPALPPWVRYVHAPSVPPGAPYNRSLAFNVGARAASGDVLVLHDGDMLPPSCYARDLHQAFVRGYDVVNLKRFVFYLDAADTALLARCSSVPPAARPEAILQNATGGGSLGVGREAYERIGGHDEGFVGWGGEDVEFWERARTLRLYPFAHLPLIHLWHAPQPDKTPEKASAAMQRLWRMLEIPVEERISALRRAGTQEP